MKTVLVKGWWPEMIGIPEEEVSIDVVKEHCIRAGKYDSEAHAMWAYAECMADWSKLLDENDDVSQFCETAALHILNHDWDWLEENFI